jgi:hypothetical protein
LLKLSVVQTSTHKFLKKRGFAMKTSLLAATVLSSLILTGVAKATPATPPIQILQAGVVINSIPVKAPATHAGAKAAAANKAASSDAASLEKERRAESEFKGANGAVSPAPQKADNAIAVVKPVARKAAPAKAAAKAKAAPAKAAAQANAASRVAAAPVAAPAYVSKEVDAASLITARCATHGKKTLRCMKLEIAKAANDVDTTETKLLNCRESRKFENQAQAQSIEAHVNGLMFQLRYKATQGFNKEVAASAPKTRLQAREIELRAILKHANEVSSLADYVCSAQAFEMGMEAEAGQTVQ